jgi:hypothetical protein
MRKAVGVLALAVALAACKRSASDPVAPTEPISASAQPDRAATNPMIGHAMCVSMKACMNMLQPMLASKPMPASFMQWYARVVDEERPGGVVVILVEEGPRPVFVLPLRAGEDPLVGVGKDPMRIVDGHALIGGSEAMVEAAAHVDLSALRPTAAPGVVVDGHVDLAAVPEDLRAAWTARIAEREAASSEYLREVLPFDLARDALAQSDALEVDLLQVDGHLELDVVIPPRPDTRLAQRAAANGNPRSRLVAAVPAGAIVQAGMVERIVVPDDLRAMVDGLLTEALARSAAAVAETSASEARKQLATALTADVAELARTYVVRDEPVEAVAYLPADSSTVVLLLRGIDPALAGRVASNFVHLARDQGVKSAQTKRVGGLEVHSASFPAATTDLVDRLGRNIIVRAAMSGDTFITVLGGDKKPAELKKIAAALARAEERAVANRWAAMDIVAFGRFFAVENAFLKTLAPTDGAIAASLTSDGHVWRIRFRMDALSPANIGRGMAKEKSP